MFGSQLTKSLLLTNKLLNSSVKIGQCVIPMLNYATKQSAMAMGKMKKGVKKMAGKSTKIILPVETDAKKLVRFCCGSNIYKNGEDVELKSDSEYPDWLWNIRLGPPPPLEELDPNTKEYWKRVRKLRIHDKNLWKKYNL